MRFVGSWNYKEVQFWGHFMNVVVLLNSWPRVRNKVSVLWTFLQSIEVMRPFCIVHSVSINPKCRLQCVDRRAMRSGTFWIDVSGGCQLLLIYLGKAQRNFWRGRRLSSKAFWLRTTTRRELQRSWSSPLGFRLTDRALLTGKSRIAKLMTSLRWPLQGITLHARSSNLLVRPTKWLRTGCS